MYCTESSEQNATHTQLQPQHMSNCMQLQDSSNNDDSVAHTISGMCFMTEQPEGLSSDCNATTLSNNLDAFTPFSSNIGAVPFPSRASLTDGYAEEYVYCSDVNGIVDNLAALVPKPSVTNQLQLQQELLQQQQLQKQLQQIYHERQQTLRQLQQQHQQLLHLAAMVQSQQQQHQQQQVTCNCMTQQQQQSSTAVQQQRQQQQRSTVPVDCACLLNTCNCMQQQAMQTKQQRLQQQQQQATNSKLCSRSLQTIKQTIKPEQAFEQTILRFDLPCLLGDCNCNTLTSQQQQQQQLSQTLEQPHAHAQCQSGAALELQDQHLSSNLISADTQQPQNLVMKSSPKSNWNVPSECMCGAGCASGNCTKNSANYSGSNNNLTNCSPQKANGSGNNASCMKSGCPQCGCWHFPRCSNWFWHPCVGFLRLAGDNSPCKNSVCNQRR